MLIFYITFQYDSFYFHKLLIFFGFYFKLHQKSLLCKINLTSFFIFLYDYHIFTRSIAISQYIFFKCNYYIRKMIYILFKKLLFSKFVRILLFLHFYDDIANNNFLNQNIFFIKVMILCKIVKLNENILILLVTNSYDHTCYSINMKNLFII